MEAVEIDGSLGEGGGQIARTSLSLSALTGRPLRLYNIRAGRDPPGLKPQHLACARAVRSIARGVLEGAEEGSEELTYSPVQIYGGNYEFDIGTAGSAILLAQAILPLLFAASKKSRVMIRGGTHVPTAPTYEYFEKIFLPALSMFGLEARCSLRRAGFFPRGGGEITLETSPGAPKPVSLWPRESSPHALIICSNLPLKVPMREKKVFLSNDINEVYMREYPASGAGNAVLLWRGFCGSAVLGEKGLRSEEVSRTAIEELEGEGDAEVDHRLADQLLLYAALAGKTRFKTSRLSKHTETSIYVIEKFLGKKFFREGNELWVE
ncbi:MAG: RNA 3'-terminal phosphate cyclase [Candidatus Bilamarchaeaceae archaeon]